MAANDGVPEALQVLLSDELLSPSELFKERSRSHKIPVKGQKEFLPDGSDQQRARLQKSLDEHWTLVAEERVERLGNLVSAEWIPKEKLVKLLSPAGKFWQTMGFSDRGKQCLLPEEALYLMECGSVQVFYKDLPLSIQEGYECLLSPETMTLHQYQVFGHLKRLGYVVNRFDPSQVPSLYERQLNLPLPRDMQSKQLKRKRSQSPGSRLCEKQSATTMEQTTVEGECKGEVQIREPDLGHVAPEQGTTQQTSQDKSMECVANSDGASARNWWTDMSGQAQAAAAQAAAPRWDFSCIVFPDLGSHRANSATLAAPDPSLLPGALEVGECKVAHWLRKLNLKKERLSRRDWERQRERDRYKRDINDDREVRRCRNWMEYLDLMEKRRSQQHKERPAHLWEQKVTPLTHPGQCISHRELLEQISIIPSCDLLEGASRLPWSDKWRICFNVYQPDTVAEFKKSHPGKPYTRLCVCSFDGPVPDLCVIKQLSILSGDVPVTFAVVDHGDISFYCFKEFKLPTDIY
ncbi:tRNA-splicing endonuclease subunit Sen54 isoform X1 [Electrophorus electricus]|uniref:tRNA-splicing endonuclease subunit Sen54 N-terminal domain-containing protein n=1 Tax=Electrophorus electricus TaxID=8005 RepID=A0A4W4H7J9_ELEEL|nr:tRNA-splicing endonuclease subunit Sen54 isoform X1 [Electrophorus electricus]